MKLSRFRMALRHLLPAALLGAGLFAIGSAQDRNIQINEVYPADMFMTQSSPVDFGKRIIDVTKLDQLGIKTKAGATVVAYGDGIHDDSDAIIAAMDWVMDRLRLKTIPATDAYWDEYWMIYFPNGTYKVSKPLVYSGAQVPYPYPSSMPAGAVWEGTCRLMLVGQSREGTILKVADTAPAFDNEAAPVPVVAFSKFDVGTTFNNIVSGNQFRNFTINVGQHAGAIGVDFTGANTARLDNILIVGAGKYGIHHRIGTAHGYYSNITVVGMDYGIYMQEQIEESHPTYEYVTLMDQSQAGICQVGVSSSFRRVYSWNTVPAVQLLANAYTTSSGSLEYHQPHMVIVDSQFKNGAPGNTVFKLGTDTTAAGFLFARNITVSGYGSTVQQVGAAVVAGSIQEYVSAPSALFTGRVSSSFIKSMNLPVVDYPLVPWEANFSKWANVETYPGANDTERIQNAMNDASKSVVYFPKTSYTITGTITIPPAIKQVIAANALLNYNGNTFSVAAGSPDLLVLNSLNLKSGQLVQSAARDLFFESSGSRGNLYDSNLTATGTRLFVNNAAGYASQVGSTPNISTWVRWNDNEKGSDNQFNADAGCTMWMLGFKSEKTWVVFQASGNSRFEVLGGVMSQMGGGPKDPDPFNLNSLRPGVINNGSQFSIVAATIGTKTYASHHWSPLLRDIQGTTMNWTEESFPARGWNQNVVLPLYASYVPVDNQMPAAPTGLTATAGSQAVELVWSASTAATSYRVYRSTTSNGQGAALVSNLPTSSYSDTGLTNNVTYYYKVTAVNAAGESALSSEASATPTAGTVPAAPTGLAALAGNQQIVLAWNQSAGSTSYNVYRSLTSNNEGASMPVAAATNSYTDTGLANGTTYYYKVAGVNASGVSALSNEASATPVAGSVPPAPTGLTATAGNQQVALAWNASAGATSYNLYRGTTSNGQGGTPLVTSITATTYTNTGLTNGITYYYKVAAVNANGTGSQSGEASATPVGTPVKLTVSTATASDSESANPPSKAIDGSTSTRWNASVLSCPPTHWLQLDLGSVKTVNMVKTMFFNGLTYTYDIQVSTDNVNFTTAVGSHNTTVPYAWETDSFSPVSARYIRINITSKNGGGPNTKPGIVEAEVYQ